MIGLKIRFRMKELYQNSRQYNREWKIIFEDVDLEMEKESAIVIYGSFAGVFIPGFLTSLNQANKLLII